MSILSVPALSLDEKIYLRFYDLIHNRTGLVFGDSRRDSVVRAILENCQHEQAVPLEYLDRLQAARTDSDLWRKFIQELTICESYFFRDAAQMNALRQRILPELIDARRDSHTLRLWSAGCASGEEPYTLALLLAQLIPDLEDWHILILATDINQAILDKARLASYNAWSFRQTEPEIIARYFTRQKDRFILSPAIRSMVTFSYLNLVENAYPSFENQTQALDLILCRNVNIYLPTNVSKKVASRFYNCLSPQGWLMVGASEANSETYCQYDTLFLDGAIIYRKGSAAIKPAWPVLMDEPGLISPLTRKNHSPLVAVASVAEAEVDTVDACQRARQAANLGQLNEAEEWARLAIEQVPLDPETHYTLALILLEQNKLEMAYIEFKKAIYLEPKFILAYFSLANLCSQLGHTRDAARYRQCSIQLASGLPDESVLPGSEDLTIKQLLNMLKYQP